MARGFRALAFSTSLMMPPLPELSIKKQQVLALFAKMQEPGGYAYENFESHGGRFTLSTKREGGKSSCQLGPEAIRIDEEKPEMGVDDFVIVVETILQSLPEVPPIFLQRCRVEGLIQPQHFSDSRMLLAGKVARVLDKIEPFERPPSYFGVRFRFEPYWKSEHDATQKALSDDADSEGQAIQKIVSVGNEEDEILHDGFFQVRFETYSKDITQVWMEVAASYLQQNVLHAGDPAIGLNIRKTYDFLTVKCKAFLDQFDVKKQTEGD